MRLLCLLCLLRLAGPADAAGLRGDALASHIADYVRTNFDPYVKNAAEFQLNALRDSQGRVGPVDMPNCLLGDIVGDIEPPDGGVNPGTKQTVSFKVQIAILDPTAGAEGAEGAGGAEGDDKATNTDTSLGFISVSVQIDVSKDNTYVMNMEGINVEQAYDGDHKPVPVTELSSGAQDAPLAILDANEASEVVARLLVHVNTWRANKCGGGAAPPPPQLEPSDCTPMEGGSLYGWELRAGPGHMSKVVAVACKSAGDKGFWIGNIDIPRTGTTETALFGGTFPGPCRILTDAAPPSMLPMPPAKDPTGKMRFSAHRSATAASLSDADKARRTRVEMRLKGDRAAFLLRFQGAVQLGEASKFDAAAAKKKLASVGASFDLRAHDVSGVDGSADACFHAPNRVRNQRDCMSCWAFACASVYGDRKCLAERTAILSTSDPATALSQVSQAPPTLYSPASALACRKPATCILGGFTNFVSMIESGIAKESCFPYKLRTDGATRFKAATGEMFLEGDVVPSCPAKPHGGDGMCPGSPGKEYVVEDVKELGVYRIHNNIDATRLAILMGGPVTAAISWSGDPQAGSDFMNYGSGAKCGTAGAVAGSCSNFDAKAGKDDPITLPGKSKLPKGSGGSGHAAGHALSIVGWECKDGSADCAEGSWIVQNSWGNSWGDDGYGHIAFGAMDIESQIFLIDVGGVYEAKLSANFLPPSGGEPVPGSADGKQMLEGQESRNPDQVLRRDFGVVHDHGGGFFFVKALKAGLIAEKQNEVFGTKPHVVLTLKWKLSKGGICTVMTFRKGPGKEEVPIACPVEAGAESFMDNVDMTGCVLQVAKSGMWTVGACSKDTGQCQLSHTSDASKDHKTDSMDGEGHTGIDTEADAQSGLQDKNMADLILASQQGGGSEDEKFLVRIVCTLGDDPQSEAARKVAQQEIEVDPRPSAESCDSTTLESMGNCKAPTFVAARPVPGSTVAVLVPPTTGTGASGLVRPSDIKAIVSPEESLRRAKENEKLALDEAKAETTQAEFDEKEASREAAAARARCPTNLVGVEPEMSDGDAQQAIVALGMGKDEMAVLSEKGHDAAWQDCSWPERLAMAKMFQAELSQGA